MSETAKRIFIPELGQVMPVNAERDEFGRWYITDPDGVPRYAWRRTPDTGDSA